MRYLDHHLFDFNWLFATHERASHPNDNPTPHMGNLPISRPAVCVSVAAWIRRRLALSSAASASARRKAQKLRPLACVLIFGRRLKTTRRAIMVPNAWLGVYQLLARYHQHKVCLFGIQCFGYPMPLLLTPMAVEEYGIDVLFCAYSLVVVPCVAFCGGCYGDIQ